METMFILAVAGCGAVVGAVIAGQIGRSRHAARYRILRAESDRIVVHETERRARAEEQAARAGELEHRNRELQEHAAALAAQAAATEARAESAARQHEHERQMIEQMTVQLQNTFQALSSKALESNNEQFMQLAKAAFEQFQVTAQGDLSKRQAAIELLVKPMQQTLQNVERQFTQIEQSRVAHHATLVQQIQALEGTASTLATALRSPKARGRWGEMQLRRVVELAGMVDHCDFQEQASTHADGARLQPDLVVNMVGGKHIVIDAKTPMDSYLKAVEAADEQTRNELLRDHAARVRTHVVELSRKEYWKQFAHTPEFVVLFLPGENLFGAALDHEPDLIAFASAKRVVIATPTTLIATLWAIAHGWREQAITDNALRIRDLGREMYERAAVVAEQWSKVGRHLDKAVGSYNQSVASMESRFLVSARKMVALEVRSDKQIDEIVPVDESTRDLTAAEFVSVDDHEVAQPAPRILTKA